MSSEADHRALVDARSRIVMASTGFIFFVGGAAWFGGLAGALMAIGLLTWLASAFDRLEKA